MTLTRAAALLAVAPLLVACVPPEGVTQANLAAYDAAVASIGCDMVNESDYLPVELQTGIPREKLLEIGGFKVSTGDAVQLENGGVRLVTGACEPAVEVAEAAG